MCSRLALDDRRAGRRLRLASARARRCRARALPDATPKHLPRWRGFNLLDKFMADQQKPFEERDFADIAELGFDFVRLPLDYRCWTDRASPKTLKEPVLKEIDQAVEFGRKHGIHVQINFHRAPGFTVARPAGAEVALDRPRDPGRLRPPLGGLRGALPGHAEQRGQLQPVQRARRQGQAGGPPPRGRAGRRGDPRARSEAADRLRRPCLGHHAARPS